MNWRVRLIQTVTRCLSEIYKVSLSPKVLTGCFLNIFFYVSMWISLSEAQGSCRQCFGNPRDWQPLSDHSLENLSLYITQCGCLTCSCQYRFKYQTRAGASQDVLGEHQSYSTVCTLQYPCAVVERKTFYLLLQEERKSKRADVFKVETRGRFLAWYPCTVYLVPAVGGSL